MNFKERLHFCPLLQGDQLPEEGVWTHLQPPSQEEAEVILRAEAPPPRLSGADTAILPLLGADVTLLPPPSAPGAILDTGCDAVYPFRDNVEDFSPRVTVGRYTGVLSTRYLYYNTTLL